MVNEEESLRRLRALQNGDFNYFQEFFVNTGITDLETCIIAFHKATYYCVYVSEPVRRASGRWLKDRGYKGLWGERIRDDDEPLSRDMVKKVEH